MILGSDSHTRYGALGTMAIGEGGPELVKQLLGRTYDIDMPEVVAIHLTGAPKPGVGPQDVALAIIGAVFKNGFVKNKVMEFVGDGIANLPVEYRNGIDVMTTETTCLSSVWMTDDAVKDYYETHKRPGDYKKLCPGDVAYYDAVVKVDLSKIENMIALPFHPSNVVTIKELNLNPDKYLDLPDADLRSKITPDGKVKVDQGIIAGCAGGTFDNLWAAADILKNRSVGSGDFTISAYPASQPVYTELMKSGAAVELLSAGVTLKTAFCGPCFGAGDVPANGALSIRHSTRNFPNREGSKPGNNQSAYVALMDARSIAATAANGGILTAATDLDVEYTTHKYSFDDSAYRSRVYNGYGRPDDSCELRFGPNIADWPEMSELGENQLLKVCSVITDPVTTTDELIPSGETSSYRSNPLKLAEFALSRKDPEYVAKTKAALDTPCATILDAAKKISGSDEYQLGSVIYATKPGDGSAREQAASCQKVLGGLANIAVEYATKRYRSNLINWGMLPLIYEGGDVPFANGDYVYLPGIRHAIETSDRNIKAYIIHADGSSDEIALSMADITDDEKDIILSGCLINYYRSRG